MFHTGNVVYSSGRVYFPRTVKSEKEEQKRIERTAKQRLAALKSNDEEAYLKLLTRLKTRGSHNC